MKRRLELVMRKCKSCDSYTFVRHLKDELCGKCIEIKKSEITKEEIKELDGNQE